MIMKLIGADYEETQKGQAFENPFQPKIKYRLPEAKMNRSNTKPGLCLEGIFNIRGLGLTLFPEKMDGYIASARVINPI